MKNIKYKIKIIKFFKKTKLKNIIVRKKSGILNKINVFIIIINFKISKYQFN